MSYLSGSVVLMCCCWIGLPCVAPSSFPFWRSSLLISSPRRLSVPVVIPIQANRSINAGANADGVAAASPSSFSNWDLRTQLHYIRASSSSSSPFFSFLYLLRIHIAFEWFTARCRRHVGDDCIQGIGIYGGQLQTVTCLAFSLSSLGSMRGTMRTALLLIALIISPSYRSLFLLWLSSLSPFRP